MPDTDSTTTQEASPFSSRPLGAGATLVGGAQAATAVAGALIGVIIARALGPDGTGAFNVVGSAFLLTATLATLGVGVGASFFVSRGRWTPDDAVRQLHLAAIALGLAGAGLGMVIATTVASSAFAGIGTGAVALGLAAVPFSLAITFTTFLALALDRYELYAAAFIGQAVLNLALVAVLAPLLGLIGAIAASTASYVAVSAATLAWALRALPRPSKGWLRRAAAQLWRAGAFGVKSYLSGTLHLVNLRIDIFFLNAAVATATVGQYAVAVAVTSLGLLLPRSLASVLMPRVARLDEIGADEPVVGKAARHATLIGGSSLVVLSAALLLVPLVYGDQFRPAVELGFILVPGIAALGFSSILGYVTVGKGFPQYALYSALAVTPLTVLAYALLIPRLGAEGAAIASTGSYVTTAIISWLFFRHVTGLAGVRPFIPARDDLADYGTLATRLAEIIRLRRPSGT